MSEVSEKQVEANCRNALKGGVKSEAGKEKVKLNALRHGLLSQEICLESENKETLQELVNNLFLSIQPEGELEKILANRYTVYYTSFRGYKLGGRVKWSISLWQ